MTKKSDRRHIIPRVSGAGEKPLYLQISEAVKKEIREGRISAGSAASFLSRLGGRPDGESDYCETRL